MGQEVLERFGKYFLLDRIGSGGMASIFRARPASLDANGRIMVIKRLLPSVANDPQFLNMFKAETQVCMAFSNTNIVQIHDFGEVAKQAYLAMEYVEGKNLKEVLLAFSKENEFVPLEMVLNVIEQAARGLHYAHVFKNAATGEKLNLIHRDISPHNILLAYDGNVKVIDFGIAKVEMQTAETTREGVIKGKVGYLSPEQITGDRLDARSDIFSLGTVLWELLTGQRLFGIPGQGDLAVIQSIQNCEGHVLPPSQMNPRVPLDLDAIVMRALTKEPGARYQSAEELAIALRHFQGTHFPTYGISEVSARIKELYANQITQDHTWLLELNQKAQLALASVPTIPLPEAPTATGSVTTQSGGSRSSSGDVTTAVAAPPPIPGSEVAPADKTHRTITLSLPLLRIPKVTRGRVLGAVLYTLTVLAIKMDEKFFFLERFMMPTDYVKLVSDAHADPARPSRAPASVPLQKQIILKLEMLGNGAALQSVFVDDQSVDLRNPYLRVQMDRPLTLQVSPRGRKPYRKSFVIRSAELVGMNTYSLKVGAEP